MNEQVCADVELPAHEARARRRTHRPRQHAAQRAAVQSVPRRSIEFPIIITSELAARTTQVGPDIHHGPADHARRRGRRRSPSSPIVHRTNIVARRARLRSSAEQRATHAVQQDAHLPDRRTDVELASKEPRCPRSSTSTSTRPVPVASRRRSRPRWPPTSAAAHRPPRRRRWPTTTSSATSSACSSRSTTRRSPGARPCPTSTSRTASSAGRTRFTAFGNVDPWKGRSRHTRGRARARTSASRG